MNLILVDEHYLDSDLIKITDPRQLSHIRGLLDIKVGDSLKVGIREQSKFDTEVMSIADDHILVRKKTRLDCPNKLPVTLIVALPRPKVLRRLIMDSVSLGVQKIVLLHSYRVDKSYWQTPFLSKLEEYIQLGLEQAGDVITPEIILEKRFKPFVEDRLSEWTTTDTPTFVAHPYGTQRLPSDFNQSCHLVIGPEGGFIPYEIELFKNNGCQIMTLGNRILRTETAISTTLGRLFTDL